MNERKRTWLITGVSTGLGRALAEAALRRGEVVIGTLRKRRTSWPNSKHWHRNAR